MITEGSLKNIICFIQSNSAFQQQQGHYEHTGKEQKHGPPTSLKTANSVQQVHSRLWASPSAVEQQMAAELQGLLL